MKNYVSLEVAKKLQEFGYKSESKWYWVHDLMGGLENELKQGNCPKNTYSWNFYPAPTATELAENLPHNTSIMALEENAGEEWLCENSVLNVFNIKADTLPDALGLMMVYLLENNLLNK